LSLNLLAGLGPGLPCGKSRLISPSAHAGAQPDLGKLALGFWGHHGSD
jgi:hypothetical protein